MKLDDAVIDNSPHGLLLVPLSPVPLLWRTTATGASCCWYSTTSGVLIGDDGGDDEVDEQEEEDVDDEDEDEQVNEPFVDVSPPSPPPTIQPTPALLVVLRGEVLAVLIVFASASNNSSVVALLALVGFVVKFEPWALFPLSPAADAATVFFNTAIFSNTTIALLLLAPAPAASEAFILVVLEMGLFGLQYFSCPLLHYFHCTTALLSTSLCCVRSIFSSFFVRPLEVGTPIFKTFRSFFLSSSGLAFCCSFCDFKSYQVLKFHA